MSEVYVRHWLVAAVRDARRQLGWGGFRPVLAVALAIMLLRVLENSDNQWPPYRVSGLLAPLLAAPLVYWAAMAAGLAVQRGVGAFTAYGTTLLVAAVSTATVLLPIRQVLVGELPANGVDSLWVVVSFLVDVLGVLEVGGVGMLVHHHHRVVRRIVDGLRDAQLERQRLERHMIECGLEAARATIEPRVLLEALAQVRASYRDAPAEADASLERLIDSLRARRTLVPQ